MRCDLDKVPSVGLFGMVVHQGGLRAQKMFDKYGSVSYTHLRWY